MRKHVWGYIAGDQYILRCINCRLLSNVLTSDTECPSTIDTTAISTTYNPDLTAQSIHPVDKHKCHCPWDGPTGVYAKGCSCGGI